MTSRCAAGLAVFAVLALGSEAKAETGRERFNQSDYADYFAGGRYETYSPYFDSTGWLEIRKSELKAKGASYIIFQTSRTLDVSANYDVRSIYPYYKILDSFDETLVWNSNLDAMVSEFTDRNFDNDAARVWESNNTVVNILVEDIARGDLRKFYRDADERAGRDAPVLEEVFRANVVGKWSFQCDHLRGDEYEVECRAKHLPTGRVESHRYRRNIFTS